MIARRILAMLAPDFTGEPEPPTTPTEHIEDGWQWCDCPSPKLIGAWNGATFVVASCGKCNRKGEAA